MRLDTQRHQLNDQHKFKEISINVRDRSRHNSGYKDSHNNRIKGQILRNAAILKIK